jgi:hypothetical protein
MGAWETRSVRRTQRKCPLCEAGLLCFSDQERSDESNNNPAAIAAYLFVFDA